MATRDTFVTVADGDQLNDGYFNGIKTEIDAVNGSVTISYTAGNVNQTTAAWADVLSVTSPATKFDGQYVLIEAHICGSATGVIGTCARVYDNTNSTALDSYSTTSEFSNFNDRTTVFYGGKVAVPTAGNTLNIKIQIQGDGSDTMTAASTMIKLTLVPN